MIYIYKILRKVFFFIKRFKPSYFFYKYFFGGAIRKINGYKMHLDLKNDNGISQELFKYRRREHFSTDFVINSKIIKRGDVVLDLGANIGYYALIESGLVGDNGMVYAIEPVSGNFNNLEKNIRLNNIENIKTFRLAVGDQNKDIDIHIHEKGNWSSILPQKGKEYLSSEKISMVKVDDFVKAKNIKPSLVRMDVEGYEYAFLRGMKSIIENYSPQLLIEIHPHILSLKEKLEICDILKNNYSKATVIRDPNSQYMNLRNQLNPILLFLSKKIGDYTDLNSDNLIPFGKQEVDIETLFRYIKDSKFAFHAFIFKE